LREIIKISDYENINIDDWFFQKNWFLNNKYIFYQFIKYYYDDEWEIIININIILIFIFILILIIMI
jgi:hypothetical protein